MTDTRIVYGARCTWWDSIDKVGKRVTPGGGHGIPCCPHCQNVLFEMKNINEWNASIAGYVKRSGDTSYPALVEWMRGKCFPDINAAKDAYEQAQRPTRDNSATPPTEDRT